MHSFTGSASEATAMVDLGLYIGESSCVTLCDTVYVCVCVLLLPLLVPLCMLALLVPPQ